MSSSSSSLFFSSGSRGPCIEPIGSPFIEPLGSPFSCGSLRPSPTPGTGNHAPPFFGPSGPPPVGPISPLARMNPILNIGIKRIYATRNPFFFGYNTDIRDELGISMSRYEFRLKDNAIVPILRKYKTPLHGEIPPGRENAIEVTFLTDMDRITVVVIDNNFEECFVFRRNGHLMRRCFDTIVVFFKGFNDDAPNHIGLRTLSRKRLLDENSVMPYVLASNEERLCATSVRIPICPGLLNCELYMRYQHSPVDHNRMLNTAVLGLVKLNLDAEQLYYVFNEMTNMYTYPLCV